MIPMTCTKYVCAWTRANIPSALLPVRYKAPFPSGRFKQCFSIGFSFDQIHGFSVSPPCLYRMPILPPLANPPLTPLCNKCHFSNTLVLSFSESFVRRTDAIHWWPVIVQLGSPPMFQVAIPKHRLRLPADRPLQIDPVTA